MALAGGIVDSNNVYASNSHRGVVPDIGTSNEMQYHKERSDFQTFSAQAGNGNASQEKHTTHKSVTHTLSFAINCSPIQ